MNALNQELSKYLIDIPDGPSDLEKNDRCFEKIVPFEIADISEPSRVTSFKSFYRGCQSSKLTDPDLMKVWG